MTSRFIVRLLDEGGTLLAWAEVHATAKPQSPRGASCPFFAMPTQFVIEHEGIASQISVHWADLDVARQQALMNPTRVQIGQVFTFSWLEPIWLVAGMRDVQLPGVTVRGPVSVGIPTGGIGVRDPRLTLS
jgi:hypothetical protein